MKKSWACKAPLTKFYLEKASNGPLPIGLSGGRCYRVVPLGWYSLTFYLMAEWSNSLTHTARKRASLSFCGELGSTFRNRVVCSTLHRRQHHQ